MNKNGKNQIGMILTIVISLALLVGILAWAGVLGNVGQSNVPAGGCPEADGTLTVTSSSRLIGGTDPSSPTVTCGQNGGKVATAITSGTTTFPVGTSLECLVSKADYIDRSYSFDMECGGSTLEAELYYATSDNPSITIKDPNNGDATVTDAVAGGATNLTNVDVGATVDFEVEFKGTNGEGTGDMIYVIEFPASTSANITDVTMGGLTEVAIPTVHSSVNAGSKIVAFAVPNVEGATKKEYSVIATLGTGKDLIGGIYTDVYAGQEFIDDDKTITSGVEDSDGTAKYENTLDYDFYVPSA